MSPDSASESAQDTNEQGESAASSVKWQTSLQNPNFAEYAELCGAMGVRVTGPSELDDAMQKALAHDGPALVEILTDVDLI